MHFYFATKISFFKNTHKILIPVLLFCFLLSAPTTYAATLSIEPANVSTKPGGDFLVTVMLDTEGDTANAIEGSFVFPDTLELKEIRDQGSAISLWVERPKLTSPGIISFSGITPGGYAGSAGIIFSVVLSAPQNGVSDLVIKDISLLRNDGMGSPIATVMKGARVASSPRGTAPVVAAIDDENPPEPFAITFASDPALWDGRWFASFQTQDKGSGIDRYEIAERDLLHLFTPEAKLWMKTDAPYPLRDRSLTGILKVKAVDRVGNERIVTIPEPRFYYALVVFALGVFGFFVLVFWQFTKR